jgi:hypothetical protein
MTQKSKHWQDAREQPRFSAAGAQAAHARRAWDVRAALVAALHSSTKFF